VPSGYRSQSPRGYQDSYDDDSYNSPAADNRYAPSRTPQHQQRGRYNDEYELNQTNGGVSNIAAGDIYTMPGYLAEVRSGSIRTYVYRIHSSLFPNFSSTVGFFSFI
jgi:hypothetical protein